jgi:hypothetical protein
MQKHMHEAIKRLVELIAEDWPERTMVTRIWTTIRHLVVRLRYPAVQENALACGKYTDFALDDSRTGTEAPNALDVSSMKENRDSKTKTHMEAQDAGASHYRSRVRFPPLL